MVFEEAEDGAKYIYPCSRKLYTFIEKITVGGSVFASDELWVLLWADSGSWSDLDLESGFSSVSKASGYQTLVMSIVNLSGALLNGKGYNMREAYSQRN